jgi:RNA polymerase sigma factor (sigma-70 family)
MLHPVGREREASELLDAVFHLLKKYSPSTHTDHLRDAAAEAVCRYFERHRSRGTIPRHPKGWLYRVGINCLRAEYRRERRFLRTSHHDGVPMIERLRSDAQTDALAGADRMRTLLLALGTRASRIVWLHGVEGRKPAEIAEMEGSSVEAIYTRLKRAHRTMRTILAEDRSRPGRRMPGSRDVSGE